MLDSVQATISLPAEHNHIADVGLGTSLYLALKMERAIFLEDEPGVGKTKIAKVLSRAFDTPLIGPQCYEGLGVNQAVYGSLEDIARHLATLDDSRVRPNVHHTYSSLHGEGT